MKMLQFPLFKIAIGFVLGLIIGYQVLIPLNIAIGLVGILFIMVLIFYRLIAKKKLPFIVFDGTTLLLSFAMGICILGLHTESNHKNNYTHHPEVFEKPNWIGATIREKLKSSHQNNRYIALIETINGKTQSGKIILNCSKDEGIKTFEVGMQLRFKAQLIKNTPPKNPNQFDYSSYLKNKQIYAQVYLEPSSILWHKIPSKSIWYYTSRIRSRIVYHLQQSGFDETALPVAMALILGQQQDIDSTITKDYQYAGAVHILSVSGLHIAAIVWFLNYILMPIPNNRKGSLLKLMISLVSLAFFGILAGLAPSVVRSITMFSFVAVGHYLRRSTTMYHTLVVSMLLILLFQPYFLFDVGFQLSYAALFFIVWLQPLLAKNWNPKNKISRFFWNIITVSFAAQIGTLPLSLYYFHQFPGLFFISNLVVLPLLGIIMIVGVIVMGVAAFSSMPVWCIKPLECGITLMNNVIHWVASLEQFVFVNVPFNFDLLLASYFIIIAMTLWFTKRNFYRTVALLCSIAIVQLVFIKIKLDYSHSKEWVVLNAYKKSYICERIGNRIVVFSGRNSLNEKLKNTVVQNYATGNFGTITKYSQLKNLAYFNENRILILDSSSVYLNNQKPDIVLLTHSPKVNLERLLQNNKPKTVIADGSNYKSMIELWKNTCGQYKIAFHSTAEKGYFVLKK